MHPGPPAQPANLLPALRLHDRPALHAARWGAQLHIDSIPADDPSTEHSRVLSRGQVAGYLAKYATKHTEALGAALDRRVSAADLPSLPASPHVRRFLATALQLAARCPRRTNGRPMRLDRWTHQLGYGGHWLTKSRRWSTTFTALRQARKEYQATQRPSPTDRTAEHEQPQGAWQLTGFGYRLPADAHLAHAERTEAVHAREALREQRAERELAKAIAA